MNAAPCGQAGRAPAAHSPLDDRGFIMVVLLIGMAVAAVWMASALPAWQQQAQRGKEAELIYRGEQYARAIRLYYNKNGTYPPTIDLLVSQRYLRKKYLDPMTGKDFLPLAAAVGRGGQVGITGVRSTSNDASIVVYANQSVYSQFPFETVVNQRMAATLATLGPAAPAGGRTTQPVGGPGGAGPGGPARGGPGGGLGIGGGVTTRPGGPGGGVGPAAPPGPTTGQGPGAPGGGRGR